MSSGTGYASVPGGQSDSNPAEMIKQRYINNAASVTTMPGGLAVIRESITLGTSAETFDFSAQPIIAATIYVMPIATVTAENISAVVCIDPPSALVRDTWLTAADALSSNSQRIPVSIYQPLEVVFSSAIDYIGAKIDIGTDQECRLIIVGVAA